MLLTKRSEERSLAKPILLVLAIAACPLMFSSCGESLKEASSDFDLKDVGGFLQVVSGLVESGFGLEERNQVLQMIKSMKVDESKSVEFKVTFKAQPTPLRVTDSTVKEVSREF